MVRRAKEKSKIEAIPNKYKNTYDDLINGSNTESPNWSRFLDWLRPIDKKIRNVLRSRSNLEILLEKNCKNILIKSFKLVTQI